MTFGSCSTDHNDGFLNGKNFKKTKKNNNKKTSVPVHIFKIAALSSCPIIHLKSSNMVLFTEYMTFLQSSPETLQYLQ